MVNNIGNNKVFKSFVKYKRINISIIVSVIVICFLLIWVNQKNNKNDVNHNFIDRSSFNSHTIEDAENEVVVPDRTKELEQAYAKNSDTVGWIYIPGTTVDWPIVKGVNNDYYLRKNENKEYSFEGCIFGDFYSEFFPINKLSNNVVLHGHNLDDNPEGKRFAQLVKFQDIEFAQNTPYIFLTTRDASLVYEIYAVFFTDIKFGYTKVGMNEKLQQDMIDSAKKRSEFIYDVDVSGKDKIITLSTCTYRYGKYGSPGQMKTRYAIQGKLLEETDQLKRRIDLVKNPTPKKPNLD